MAAYFGLNYLLIAALQTNTTTTHYGFAVQTGALIASGLLGLLWLWVAWKDGLQISFKGIPAWRWFLLPLALLVFWSPIGMQGSRVVFDFNPRLLFTSPDYGLAYCFMTPVLLFLVILGYPTSRFLQDLRLAHAYGSYPKLLAALSLLDLRIFDDCMRDALSLVQSQDLLDILDDRFGHSSTMVLTQIPVDAYHERIPDPTLADAILDQLVNNAYRINCPANLREDCVLLCPCRPPDL